MDIILFNRIYCKRICKNCVPYALIENRIWLHILINYILYLFIFNDTSGYVGPGHLCQSPGEAAVHQMDPETEVLRRKMRWL